ncbi:MAG: hypothetical protein LBB09_03675, partial [Rickettsiales bacterium]|nr:hypothetical protein [Rickettsiales bacterium]
MKEKKYFIIAVFAIALPIMIVTILINQSFNPKSMRNDINAALEAEIGKLGGHYLLRNREAKIRINGGIKVKIFPRPKIIINNLEIKNLQHQNVVLNGSIGSIRIDVGFGRAFRKKISFNNLTINAADINFEKSPLIDFYFKKEKVKRMIKLEGNEVQGIKGKLKEILIGKQDSQPAEGYKEMDAEEIVRVDLDNGELKKMLVNAFSSLNGENMKYDESRRLEINFSNVNLVWIKNNNILKEYKNMGGKFSKSGDAMEFKCNFTMSNLFSTFAGKLNFKGESVAIKSELTNDAGDQAEFDFDIKNNLSAADSFEELEGQKKITVRTSSLNNLIQWLLPSSSKHYARFNYKKGVEFVLDMLSDDNGIEINDLSFRSEDLEFVGKGKFGENSKIELNIVKANLDNFIIQSQKQGGETKVDDINIFRAEKLDDLLKIIREKNSGGREKNNFLIGLKIDYFTSRGSVVKDSKVELEIKDDFYRIRNFQLNINDFNIII